MFRNNFMPSKGKQEPEKPKVSQATQATARYSIPRIMEGWELAKIAEAARKYPGTTVQIAAGFDRSRTNAKSVINLSTTQIIGPTNIVIFTFGPEAEEAADAVCKCIEQTLSGRPSKSGVTPQSFT